MYKAKITSKGQVTIPIDIRRKMGLRVGDSIEIKETKEGYLIKKIVKESPFNQYVGYLGDKEDQEPDEILQELRGV